MKEGKVGMINSISLCIRFLKRVIVLYECAVLLLLYALEHKSATRPQNFTVFTILRAKL